MAMMDNYTGKSFDMEFFKEVEKRLETLGYVYDDQKDDWLLDFMASKVEDMFNNECNTSVIAPSLFKIAIDNICAEFLTNQKARGLLSDEFNFETAVKQITEGDTSVTWAVEKELSAEQKFDSLLKRLIDNGKGGLIRYRKLRW